MKVRITIVETSTVEYTYEVDGVNNLEEARKCAANCANKQDQPNTYMARKVPRRPTYNFGTMEIVEF